MRESSTYQAILDERQEEVALRGARKFLLKKIGEIRFGPPDPSTEAAIQAIDDLARLEWIGDRLLTATTWQDLLATP